MNRRIRDLHHRENWIHNCRAEAWNILEPMFAEVFKGQATYSDDGLLETVRNGYTEEIYFTWSFSPIRNQDGTVGGVYAPVFETTERVLMERRLKTMREAGSKTLSAHSVMDACMLVVESLSGNVADAPWAMMYYVRSEGDVTDLVLVHSFGVPKGGDLAPLSTPIKDSELWPWARVYNKREPHLVIETPEVRYV